MITAIYLAMVLIFILTIIRIAAERFRRTDKETTEILHDSYYGDKLPEKKPIE